MKKLNILLTNYMPFKESGGAISTYNLAKGLMSKGHNVYIASIGDYKDIPTLWIPNYKKLKLLGLQRVLLKRFFIKIIKQYNIDIIHTQEAITGTAAIFAAKKTGIKSIVHFRAYDWLCPTSSLMRRDGTSYNIATYSEIIKNSSAKMLLWNLYKWRFIKSSQKFLKHADGFISISKYVQKKYEKELGINSKVIYNIRKLDLPKKKKNKNDNRFYVTFISRLDKQKGTELIIRLANQLKKNKNMILVIAGRGKYENEIKELDKQNMQVRYLGNVPNHKIGELYAKSDVILFPSLWEEPIGGIPFEAMIAGKPIVASKVGGIPEVVINNETGFLVDKDSEKIWFFFINLLYLNSNFRKVIGEKTNEYFKRYFTEDKSINSTEKLYYEILRK